jgi:hypothetical protein
LTAILAAVGAVLWLCFLLLSIAFAQAAARGDVIVQRALAAEFARRRALEAQSRKRVQRAA